jgi:hypothetical protein
MFKRVPLLVKAGMGCGLFAGIVVGAMIGPPTAGIAFGLMIGTAIGMLSGVVMHREDVRKGDRQKELDEIIGVTSGSLGTPRGSIPPPSTDASEALAAWANEWLTPPPPAVR